MSIGAVVHLPSGPDDPVVIDDPGMTGLRAVLARRLRFGDLDPEWDKRGVYVLLGPGGSPGRYYAYVGEATKNLRKRAAQHTGKAEWTHALLVRRGTEHGFSSAHIGWLEGRLFQILKMAAACELANDKTPGDDSVHPSEAEHLEVLAQAICAVLRCLGFSPDPGAADEAAQQDPASRAASLVLDRPGSGVYALGALLSDGRTLRVYPGATARAGSPSAGLLATQGCAERRSQLLADGTLVAHEGSLTLTRAVDFPSLSAAASVLANEPLSGLASWRPYDAR